MKNLKEKWANFVGIAFSPGSVIFIILTIASLVLSFYFRENQQMSILLAVLGSLFGGLAGSFIKDDYNKISGENILEKKGLSAIRNLKSIERQLGNIRFWISGFTKRKLTKEQKDILSEIDRHISTTQLNIQSGFSDWIDMVPELAQESGRIAEITKKQKEVLRAYIEELLKKKKELIISKDEKRVEELKKRISTLEKQIKDIQIDNIHSVDMTVPFSNSPIVENKPLTFGYDFTISKCVNCGKILERRNSNINIYSSYCDECKSKLFGL